MAKKKESDKAKMKPDPIEIPIHCAHDKLVDPDKLKENPKNPNKHPEPQIAALAKIIKYQGFRQPIKVSNRSGFITCGHGRLQAAKILSMNVVPVDYQDYESEADEYADMIADNKIAEAAIIDGQAMADLIVELDGLNFPMDLTGLSLEEIESYVLGPMGATPPDDFPEVDENIETEHECPKCGYKWSGGK